MAATFLLAPWLTELSSKSIYESSFQAPSYPKMELGLMGDGVGSQDGTKAYNLSVLNAFLNSFFGTTGSSF